MARGSVSVNGEKLAAGDAIEAANVNEIVIEQGEQAEVLLFDLA